MTLKSGMWGVIFRRMWPKTTKFGIETRGEGRGQPRLYPNRAGPQLFPKLLGPPLTYAHTVWETASKLCMLIRENCHRVDHATARAKAFMTGMLMRDLFAVANFFVLVTVSYFTKCWFRNAFKQLKYPWRSFNIIRNGDFQGTWHTDTRRDTYRHLTWTIT